MRGDEIEADLEWLRGCTCELNGVTINPRFRETADKLSHALTAAEARGYERGKAVMEGSKRMPAPEKQTILEFDAKEMAAYTVGFLKCREEAAKVAFEIGSQKQDPRNCGAEIGLRIRSLKP